MQTINERIEELIDTLNITKTEFAKNLKVSQQYISKLVKTGNPSDLFIENMCQKYGVNEKWVKEGMGEMFLPKTRNQEIAEFVNEIMQDSDESFKKKFILSLKRLDVEDWKTLQKIVDAINSI